MDIIRAQEKLGQKRWSEPSSSLYIKAKSSNCGELLKTNLPSLYSNVINGTGNDSL